MVVRANRLDEGIGGHISTYASAATLYEVGLGVGIAGAGAGELIAEGVLAVEMGATAEDLKLTIHPHPTLSESLMESAEMSFGQSTHVYKPKRKSR